MFLRQVVSLSPQEQSAFEQVLSRVHCPRKHWLYRAGEVCDKLYFIESGVLREYFLDNNAEEITNWIGSENTLATSMYSFITRSPTQMYMQALEDASLVAIHYTDLQHLYEQFHAIERLGRLLTERYFIETEEAKRSLQYLNATQRYEQFLQLYPKLSQRVPLGYIASYLGISLETLSRIRAKK